MASDIILENISSVPCRIAIQDLFAEDPQPRTPREVIEALRTTYPGEWTDGTVRAHLIGLSMNHPSANHYPHLQKFAFLTQSPDGRYAVAVNAVVEPGSPGAVSAAPPGPRSPKSGRRARVDRRSRMAERVKDLAANFGHYLAEFEHRAVFGGPSVHFHVRAIERRMTHDTVRSALADDDLLELIYATLTSWGMHRMGPKGAKLVDFHPFCDGIRKQSAILEELEPLVITDVDADAVPDKIWQAVSGARLSASGTQIVAGTKALHHLLPDLIPPIDRTYTIRFFHENTLMPKGDEHAFKEVYPALVEIAAGAGDHLRVNDRSPMNTGRTKIIDNAIIGYVWGKLKVVPDEEAGD
jgi:hypothetical protein